MRTLLAGLVFVLSGCRFSQVAQAPLRILFPTNYVDADATKCGETAVRTNVAEVRAACDRVARAGGPYADPAKTKLEAIDAKLLRDGPAAIDEALKRNDPVTAQARLRNYELAAGSTGPDVERWNAAIEEATRKREAASRRSDREDLADFLSTDASLQFFRRCKEIVAATTIFFDGSTRLDRELAVARTCHLEAEAYRLALKDEKTRQLVCSACDVYGGALRCNTAAALHCAVHDDTSVRSDE